jgi:hypothetical protein
MRQAKANADAERGDRVVALYDLPENIVERGTTLNLLKCPLF